MRIPVMAKYLPLLIFVLFIVKDECKAKSSPGESLCKEWQTITLTVNEVDAQEFFGKMDEIMSNKRNITVKSGSLAGRGIPWTNVFSHPETMKDLWLKVCACHFDDAPCIPLCCKPNMEASFKTELFTCENKSVSSNTPSSIDEHFKIYLKFQVFEDEFNDRSDDGVMPKTGYVSQDLQKLPSSIPVVHHDGLNSLKGCQEVSFQKHEPGTYHLNKSSGELVLEDKTTLTSEEYCFFFNKTQKNFMPLHYCKKIKSSHITSATDNTTVKPTVKSGASNEPAVAVFIILVTTLSVVCSLPII